MRVAFIEPSIANVEPLGIGYLIQVLIDKGHEVKYFETPRKAFLERLKRFNPDVLAYSVTSGKHVICREINVQIRKHINAISLFGGPHCTFYPEFIESNALIDGVCRGEGEYAFVELLKKIERGEGYTDTANWWLRVDGVIYKNPVRERIEDLDALPFPNRDIIYAENKELRTVPFKRIMASRGCPYSCAYCFNREYNSIYRGKGKIYSSRSIQSIVEEIRVIKEKYPLTFLKFADDNFGLDLDYCEFAETYGKGVGVPFLLNIRPNLVEEDTAKYLKKAGCFAVVMAVESGNDDVRNKLLHRELSKETMSQAIASLKKAGLKVWTQNIICNPGETFDMAMETFEFNVKNRVDFAECFILTPYPGTEIYKYCSENGYLDRDWTIDSIPKSYWLDSCIREKTKGEKNRLVNFHKFFNFGVKNPWTVPLIKLLIRLPPNTLFVIFNRLYDNWGQAKIIGFRFNAYNLLITVKINIWQIKTWFIKPTASFKKDVKGTTE